MSFMSIIFLLFYYYALLNELLFYLLFYLLCTIKPFWYYMAIYALLGFLLYAIMWNAFNAIYCSDYFMVSAPGLRAPSHTNPGPVQSCLTGHSKSQNIQASGCAGRRAEWPYGNMFCSFHTIIRVDFTIMLIISNVWAGFC